MHSPATAGPAPANPLTRFLFAAEDPRRLAAVRVGLFGVLGLRVALTNFQFVAGQPKTLFDPVSLFHLLPSMPGSTLTAVVQVVCVVAAIAAAAGLAPRASFPLAFATALFLHLMLNATGKIIHNDLLLTLCLLPLLATPTAASRAWSVRSLRSRLPTPPPSAAYGWPIRLMMVIVGLAYLFAGLQKLRYSGVEWASGDNLRWVLLAASDSQPHPNGVGIFLADHSLLFHAFAFGTLVVELGFILCVPFARLRWFFVPAAIGMHLGILLTMHLDYTAQAASVLIVFVNWAAVATWLHASRGQALFMKRA